MRGSRRRVTAARAAVWSAAASFSVGVVGVGMLGSAPAVAAPEGPGDGPGAETPDGESAGTPRIWPRPQELRTRQGGVEVRGRVALVAPPEADRYALDVIRETLRVAGAREVYDVAPGAPLTAAGNGADTGADAGDADPRMPRAHPRPGQLLAEHNVPRTGNGTARGGSGAHGGAGVADNARGGAGAATGNSRAGNDAAGPSRPSLVVYVDTAGRGGPGDAGPQGQRSGAETALRALGAAAQGDLPGGGYRLAVGKVDGQDTVALSGVGGDGLFNAAQTLRQLAAQDGGDDGRDAGRTLPALAVRDWPGTGVRGMTEGFYGEPWTQSQRLAQLDFLGRTKQNRYLYAPGYDPYRQARWREPYPADRRADFRQLAERARANHVTLAWAIQPGQQFCFSAERDRRDLLRKVDAMWALGVRAFQLQLADVSYSEWHCGADREEFGEGPRAAAQAQARTANALARHLADRHPSAAPLSLLPTEFYQEGSTAYRKALAAALHDRVEVVWTGVGVVPRTITGGELADAEQAFRHPLLTQDNYPINDYADDRVFLGPYQGRDPAVAARSAAVLSNAMTQPLASRIPLFTAADYAWNPRDYDAQASWKAAVDDLAGGSRKSRDALRTLAANSVSSVLGAEESAYLRPRLAELWRAYDARDDKALARAAKRLRPEFRAMRTARGDLAAVADGALAREVHPWLAQLARYGEAGERSVDLLLAQARDDGAAAWRARADVERVRAELAGGRGTVGKGVLEPFVAKAARASDVWMGVARGASDGDKGRSEDRGGAQRRSAPEDGKPGTSGAPGKVTGGPDARKGAPRSAAADGDLGTAYEAAEAPGSRVSGKDERHGSGGTVPPGRGAAQGSADQGGPHGGRAAGAGGSAAGADAPGHGQHAGAERPSSYAPAASASAPHDPAAGAAEALRRAAEHPKPGAAAAGTPGVRYAADDGSSTADASAPYWAGGRAESYASSGATIAAHRAAADGPPGGAPTARAVRAPRPDDEAHSGAQSLTVPIAEQELRAVTVLTGPDSGTRADVEVHEPGHGWRRVGKLAEKGFTELDAKGVRANAVRLVWGEGAKAPVVYEVVPWSDEVPEARLGMPRGEADVAIGGGPVTVEAELTAQTPGAARARLSAPAPDGGLETEHPTRVTAPRGGTATARIEVSAPKGTKPGTYELPVQVSDGHGGTQRGSVTVRAYPPAGGEDLARGRTATSSADETPDFPATAAVDGKADTRWSSPAKDGEWLQVELDRPARVGEVRLRWQEAYASGYRVQVSTDGRRWRTAARVADGGGGQESVRMDERDVRYVRIQGEQRATRFGYSLWALEVYAVRD
ncbi:beta-N-acetylglucosaminidase domain-containing protein [Streptomyces boninensis]|uniref:beta-N-acetylglucosaminidase domain-containing protein n=1 Tax=Streptomyces boninensis TaxID=2039455 RepID=UPI003B20C10C